MRAQAGAGERGVGERRERDRGVRRAQALVAHPGDQRQREVAARRVTGDEDPARVGGAGRAVGEHPAIGAAAVLDAGPARMLRHQPVVHRQHGAAGERREAARQRAVAQRAADHERAAMDVERAPRRVGARRADPFAGNAATVDPGEARVEPALGEHAVHQAAQGLVALVQRHAGESPLYAAERVDHAGKFGTRRGPA